MAEKLSGDGQTTFDLPESSMRERLQQEAIIREIELKQRMKMTVVPTDDGKVRGMLRQMGEPICLFGEREMERRERLRKLLAQQEAELADAPLRGQIVIEDLAPSAELFYTEGSDELKTVRADFAQFSVKLAHQRILRSKRRRDDPEIHLAAVRTRVSAVQATKDMAQQCSEFGDDRPISGCKFAPNGKLLASCGWGGMVSVWSSEQCRNQFKARAHEERCTDVAWHPAATLTQSPGSVNLATACADATAALLSADGQVIQRLVGHTDRLARLAFHPMGKHLATASFDATWRLWDLVTGQCVVEQEGHSRPTYTVAFHPDGSLAASAGLDAIGRLWDCRTGRSIFVMEGHVKEILSLDFSPNGFHLVTGSADHTCKVWDLRTRKCMYTIPGHRSLVSTVCYERAYGGAYIVSGGYDNVVKVWSGKDFSLVKTLAGHEGKVMSVDVSPDGSHLTASASYDRTIKLWAPETAAALVA